jgi:CHC2 zinc finger
MNTADYPLDRDAIIAAHPLLEYCRSIGLDLRRAGREWKCLCPLHDEQTPSFFVDQEKNLFFCHGCETGGTVIDLHAGRRGFSIGEAMRDLSPPGGNGDGSANPRTRGGVCDVTEWQHCATERNRRL